MAAKLNGGTVATSLLSSGRVEVFVSYSHEDEAFKTGLVRHLSILRRQQLISIWYDRKIGPGEEWRGQIDCHLNTANIILLLIAKCCGF